MEVALPILREPPFLIIVVPCYNEQETLPITFTVLGNMLDELKKLNKIKEKSYICYVDDGSTDGTWNLLVERNKVDPCCRAIGFAVNAGHQNALWAGFETSLSEKADCVITLDADLQDDVNAVPLMIEEWVQGNDIVYGVRNNRDTDSAFKRSTAHLFYALMGKLNVNIIPDHADFRLLGRPALEALTRFQERNLFIRGLIPRLGFRSARVYYRRKSRELGDSKYPLRKMLSFAWTGVTSASAAPLRIAGLMSLICLILTSFLALYQICRWASGYNVPGWTSLFLAILFLGSVQLLCLAIIGEYIAKIYTEVRHRPRYIIERKL